MFTAKSFYPFLRISALLLCCSQLLNAHAQQKPLYNMFLEEAVPADGSQPLFNAPVIRWPYQKGKKISYAIQLSQDSLFKSSHTLQAEGLTGAFFNPHQSLAPGKWYWRHKVSGKEWSALHSFVITHSALQMVSPPANTFLSNIPQGHPRILVNHSLDAIHKQAGTADALAIIAEAGHALQAAVPSEKDAAPKSTGSTEKQNKKINQDAVVALGNQVNQMITALCEANLLTKNAKYFSRAKEMALEVASWDAEGITGSSDFADGICMYDMALVYDTFYDQLNESERKILQDAIIIRASGFYHSWVNNIESKVLSGHVWQLILNEFFKTSLALYGHVPEASAWLGYAYELFLARAPVLGGADGGWVEGASYFQMNMETLLEIPDKIKTYTGFDFVNTHPWYKKNASWLIYHFPAGSSADGFGDNTEELFAPTDTYLAFAIEMAKLTQEPGYAWYAQSIQHSGHKDLSNEPRLRWFRVLHAGEAALPAVPAFMPLPMGYISKESGIAALHTDIHHTLTDVMVTMRSSPFGAYGHVLSDQNAFNIMAAGKRLFFRTGYKVSMDDPHRLGWSKHTKSENAILVNGAGQPYSVEAGGNFLRFVQGENLAYIKGDASGAYRSKETKEDYGVTKAWRHMLLLKPGIVVIYDELESQQPSSWSWLIHSLETMKLDAQKNTFSVHIPEATGTGRIWSSQPFGIFVTDTFEIPPPAVSFRNYPGMKFKEYNTRQWHLRAENKEKAKQVRYLSIIQVDVQGAQPLPVKESKEPDGRTKISIGNWSIEAMLSCGQAPMLTVKTNNGSVAFSAYGNELVLMGKKYTGTVAGNSLLVEKNKEKISFAESGDEPVIHIR